MTPIFAFSIAAALAASCVFAATPEKLAEEQELFESLKVKPGELKSLNLETELVRAGQANAVICHADDPAWRKAAEAVRGAIAEATGVTLQMKADGEFDSATAFDQNLILLGHLDNSAVAARLYHNFFICLDTGYAGREGYVIRSVHNPFGTGKNCILVGGSHGAGTQKGAAAFAEMVKAKGNAGELKLGRLKVLNFEREARAEAVRRPTTVSERDQAVELGRKYFFSPGQGRSGISQLNKWGIRAHRNEDPLALDAYRELMLALLEYYQTDETINQGGMARYDNDFRDAWTFEVGILWDLHEESGVFSDAERLEMTNLCLRLALECVLYQGYNREDIYQRWLANEDIVHNHNTFPALGLYFVGNYLKRHYGLAEADKWLDVARGIFQGQRHASKPLEDAAAYQWLPIIHLMIYSLAEGDTTFFDEGHARETAESAMMVMDNAGYQGAFGDHSAEKASSGIPRTLQTIAWYYKDPGILWATRHAANEASHELGQPYDFDTEPEPWTDHSGISVSYLPKLCYDYAARSPQYPTEPNLPWEQTFDKLALRDGLEESGEYLLLDGFGRGTHMHFDANAIIRYSKGGEPLLVDGEYILNAPKHHSSLVIIRDGQAELTPAVTGLGRADELADTAYTRTWISEYNGTEWNRSMFWRRDDYLLVLDEVEALVDGEYTLRCCWRPWGDAKLDGSVLDVEHPPMRMRIVNGDGAAARYQTVKTLERMPVGRLSQQVSLPLGAGESYQFANVIHAEPENLARTVELRQVAANVFVVERPEGADAVLTPRAGAVSGLQTDARLVVLSENGVVVGECTELSGLDMQIAAGAPVSVEIDAKAGKGIIRAREACDVKLVLPVRPKIVAGQAVDFTDGLDTTIRAEAGATEFEYKACGMPDRALEFVARAEKMPGMAEGNGDDSAGDGVARLERRWEFDGFETPMAALPVKSVACEQEPYGRYGPAEKLIDGQYTSSTGSVMWDAGVAPTFTLDLGAEAMVTGVVLREWHMNEGWDVGTRKLEVSSDGFAQDVRLVGDEFEDGGTQSWGSNVNTLMKLAVGQKARQLRFTVTAAREDSRVYIAEVEVLGTRPGARPGVTDIARGDVDGDGQDEIVVASDAGEIQALKQDGKVLWEFETGELTPIHSIACGDVNGDGRAEVMFGGAGTRLGLISGAGELLWERKLPPFRGIASDVMTVLPGDVDGDGVPEIVSGAKSWQYFAHDHTGEMIWKNVIYAHSATVGCADDFDGDGKAEVVGGNAYYTLNLIDHDGTRVYSRGRFGPEQSAVGSADVDGDGLPEILIASDGGELLCFDGDGAQLWARNLGDRVTRILAADVDDDGVDEIVCSAESANVFAINADGSLLWRAALPDGTGDIALASEGGWPYFAVAAGAAGMAMVGADGRILATAPTNGRAERLVVCGDTIAVATDQGTVEGFGTPKG